MYYIYIYIKYVSVSAIRILNNKKGYRKNNLFDIN